MRDLSGTPIVYVDDRNTSVETGILEHPYNSFMEGHDVVPNGGTVALHGDSYSVAPISLSKSMSLRAYESSVQLGP